MSSKNYYGILDVASDASQEEIKSAYREKVKQYHPDHYGQDRERESFLDVREAYEVLSDPDQRAGYDDACVSHPPRTSPSWHRSPGSTRRRAGAPEPLRPKRAATDPLHPGSSARSAASFSSDPFALFEAFFDHIWSQRRPQPASTRRPAADFQGEISLTQTQAARGGDVHLEIPVSAPCPVCQRAGTQRMRSVQGGYRCRVCDGQGTVSETRTVAIAFPAGVQDDTTLVASLDAVGLKGVRVALHFSVY
jgi:molecular chaperone DnaJ